MTVLDAHTLWQAVLGDLQLRLPGPSFETWLSDTSGGSFSDGRLVISTPNTFIAEMLEHRMYSMISQAVDKIAERTVELRFEVGNSGQGDPGRLKEENPTPVSDSFISAITTPSGAPGRQSGISVNPDYSFGNFVVGKSNELAYAAAYAVASKPGRLYNPLFIYSGVGLGKTHLLNAIATRLSEQGNTPIYTTAEAFTNEYIQAIREGNTDLFRERYRSADALLLDDVQFIIGKEQTQEGFFHTFNVLHLSGRQIVITSDRPTSALALLEDRIRSRLAGGLVVDIQLPEYETRLAILRSKAERAQMEFPEGILELLAEDPRPSIRELEGCLTRLLAYSELVGAPISLDLVKHVAADLLLAHRTKAISDVDVLSAVSDYFSVDQDAIKGRRRDKITAAARQVAMYLLREDAGLPLVTIGRFLGGKDHSTVLHAHRKINDQIPVDSSLRQDNINIRGFLNSA